MFVRPFLEFCPQISSFLSRKSRIAIEKVQRSFIKSLLPPGMNYRTRCIALSIEPLWLRRLQLNLLTFHQLIHGRIHVAADRPSELTDLNYNLRRPRFVCPGPIPHTSLRQNFYLPFYTRLWNKLPGELRTCQNLFTFRKRIRRLISVEFADETLYPQLPADTLYETGPPHV